MKTKQDVNKSVLIVEKVIREQLDSVDLDALIQEEYNNVIDFCEKIEFELQAIKDDAVLKEDDESEEE